MAAAVGQVAWKHYQCRPARRRLEARAATTTAPAPPKKNCKLIAQPSWPRSIGFAIKYASHRPKMGRLYVANASRAAAIVASISASLCAADTNSASILAARQINASVQHPPKPRRKSLRVAAAGRRPIGNRLFGEEQRHHASDASELMRHTGRTSPPSRNPASSRALSCSNRS